MVTDCRKTVVAAGQAGDFVTRDCKFDPVPISKLLANRKKVMSLIGQPGWPRDGRGSLFARPPRSAEDFGGAVTSSWQEAELGKTDVCLMTLPSVSVTEATDGAMISRPPSEALHVSWLPVLTVRTSLPEGDLSV